MNKPTLKDKFDKVLSTKISYFLVLTVAIFAFQLCGCNSSLENSANLNAENKNANNANRFVNQDFSNRPVNLNNKPVNLNNEKDRKEFDKQIEKLNENRKLWEEQNFTNYDFTMQQWAEGVGSDWKLDFKVRDGKPIPFENMTYPEIHKYDDLNTIDELFDYINDSMEKGWAVRTKYNKQYGYPQEIGVYGGDNAYNSKNIDKFELVK
jgi:Family of unknown function (DUF6174)